MAEIMRMPGVLADATEAVLSKWLLEEGASFKTGDPIAEAETEKAIVEIPAERDGVIGKHLVKNGATAKVGEPILVILDSGEGKDQIEKILSGVEIEKPKTTSSTKENEVAPPVVSKIDSERLFVSPIARKMAKEAGLDAATLKGTGPDGRIVRRDVEQAISTHGVTRISTLTVSSTPGEVKSIPHSGMRKAIARRLTESKSTVPHFYLSAPLIADEFLNLRKKINEWASVKVSVTDLLLKTVAAAFQDVPDANVIWSDEALLLHHDVDISVAVATDNGLITPVVRKVNQQTLTQLSTTSLDLIERARLGKLKQNEIEGGTFSITNLGMYGTDSFSAILNPPQSMILAVGAAKPKPVVIENEIKIANVINFTLSVDHRAVDGALAAQWLQAFSKRFENPMWLVVN